MFQPFPNVCLTEKYIFLPQGLEPEYHVAVLGCGTPSKPSFGEVRIDSCATVFEPPDFVENRPPLLCYEMQHKLHLSWFVMWGSEQMHICKVRHVILKLCSYYIPWCRRVYTDVSLWKIQRLVYLYDW